MSRSRSALISVATALVLAVGAAAFSAVDSSAAPNARHFHVALTKAEPGVNDTVWTSPTALKLWFSERIQVAVTAARVTGPDGHLVPLAGMHIDAAPKSPAV